jgi:hypothetical protein
VVVGAVCCAAAGAVWTDVDAARTGNLPFVFEPDMSFEKYVDYAMDVPMYFVYREGKYINALGQSWRDFMEVRRYRQYILLVCGGTGGTYCGLEGGTLLLPAMYFVWPAIWL